MIDHGSRCAGDPCTCGAKIDALVRRATEIMHLEPWQAILLEAILRTPR